jgi:hypothetical protein
MDIILASGLAFGSDLSLGGVVRPILQPIVQKYHTSAPAAVTSFGLAAGSVLISQLVTGKDINVAQALTTSVFASGAQIALGGDVFRSIVEKFPWMYYYLAPTYTAAGVVVGMGIYEILM